jgi:hypothetical protein
MLDVMLAMALLAIGCGAVIQSMVTANTVERFATERLAALEAAESTLEALQGEVFGQVFARYDANPANNPAGVSPGPGFLVQGLEPVAGDADGMPGQIEFPGNGVLLLENVADAELGMPRDLNGDLAPPDGLDHSGDYRVLPVRLRVRWNGVRGNSELVLVTTLTNENNDAP